MIPDNFPNSDELKNPIDLDALGLSACEIFKNDKGENVLAPDGQLDTTQAIYDLSSFMDLNSVGNTEILDQNIDFLKKQYLAIKRYSYDIIHKSLPEEHKKTPRYYDNLEETLEAYRLNLYEVTQALEDIKNLLNNRLRGDDNLPKIDDN